MTPEYERGWQNGYEAGQRDAGRSRPAAANTPEMAALRAAIHDPGRYPMLHAEALRRLKADWPSLYRAVTNLVGEPT